MFNYSLATNGNLVITLDEDHTPDDLRELMEEKDEMTILIEGSESDICNGGYHPFDPDNGPSVGLTSAPCVAESIEWDDDSKPYIDGNLWWYPEYMVKSFLDEILENGRTVFKLA